VKDHNDLDTDIAIIGMAGLYPQADDVSVFWSNVLNKRDCVTDSPEGWLGDGAIFDPESDDPLRIYTHRGGFLGDLSRFDARQFGTMPLSVGAGQPDQFLALKVAHDALVDAGYPAGKHDHSATGVILGHAVHAHRGNTNGIHQAWTDIQIRNLLKTLVPDLEKDRLDQAIRILDKSMPKLIPEAIPGLVPNILTGRICNRLDLMGPNYIIDAACSSSIISVDLAMFELRSGRADMMLAGGVNTTTSPLVYEVFCSVDALSRTGRIRPFDRNANGTVLGEGAGMLVLKRLADALRDDDRIYAVIKGVGQSSDGKSAGLMAPRLEGEILAVRRAYRSTGIDPATIGLMEAHGTGIPLGDRTEVDALRTVFGQREGDVPHIPIGSVKSMIGHCIPASGSASIIKMSLALSNKILPPTLCDEVSTDLGLESTPFYLSTETRPWIHHSGTPRRAAINAFGFGGINAHMILEESPVGRAVDPTAAFVPTGRAVQEVPEAATMEQVFVFAGADAAAVLAEVDAFTAARVPEADMISLARSTWDRALTLDGPARLAILAADMADFDRKTATLKAKLPGHTGSMQTRNGIYYEPAPLGGKVAFLFPGEMGQYPDMMKDAAMAFPVVRHWFDFIGALTVNRRATPLGTVIFPPPTLVDEAGRQRLDHLMHRVDYGSEMVFAADQATNWLLTAMGVKPDAMLGHSTGENAALVASGRLKMDQKAVGQMIDQMNVIFDQIEVSGVVPKGTLLNIAALDRPALEKLLQAHPAIQFTMDNCPNQAIVFGDGEAIQKIETDAIAQGAVCTRLPISWGYHTPHVAPMAVAFGKLFDGVEIRDTGVTLYSCATARPFPTRIKAARETAVLQYTSRVRFTESVNQLYEDGVRTFIECGPNATLTAFARDILGSRPHLAVSADNRRRGMLVQLRHLAGQLFAAGVKVDPRDLLMPAEDPVEAARRIARDRQRKAPRLESNLPFITLTEAQEEELRALILPPAPATAAAAAAPQAPAPAPKVAASAAIAAAAVSAPDQAQGAMQAHIGLMQDFVAGTGRVVMTSLGQPVARTTTVEVMDLARAFALPFAFRAYLMRGEADLQALAPWLAPEEWDEAQAMAQRGAKPWKEWALSRLATKQAATGLLADMGQATHSADLAIRKTPEGAPVLAGPSTLHLPGVSISHVAALGIGAAAAPGWQMGIDFEFADRIRQPEAFLNQISPPDEQARLGLAPGAETATLVWNMKEAAAKALGQGLQGRPESFVIAGYDPSHGEAVVQSGNAAVTVQVRQFGRAFCAVAWRKLHDLKAAE
jgi:acyl transferase domain-containing protein